MCRRASPRSKWRSSDDHRRRSPLDRTTRRPRVLRTRVSRTRATTKSSPRSSTRSRRSPREASPSTSVGTARATRTWRGVSTACFPCWGSSSVSTDRRKVSRNQPAARRPNLRRRINSETTDWNEPSLAAAWESFTKRHRSPSIAPSRSRSFPSHPSSTRARSSASRTRRSLPRSSTIPTSSPSTPWAKSAASTSTRCGWWTANRSITFSPNSAPCAPTRPQPRRRATSWPACSRRTGRLFEWIRAEIRD